MLKNLCVRFLILALTLLFHFTFAQKTETRTLAPFENIFSAASIDVVLEIGPFHTARIESENIDTEKILTEVKNGTLSISIQKGSFWNIRAKIYVTLPQLNAIHLTGSGNMLANSPIEGERLTLQLNSSGNISLKLMIVKELNVKLFGTGDVQLGGSADDMELKLSGSGNIFAYGLKSLRCNAEVAGSGNIELLVLERLEARVSGSGNINYKGKPFKERKSSSGPGGIIAIR